MELSSLVSSRHKGGCAASRWSNWARLEKLSAVVSSDVAQRGVNRGDETRRAMSPFDVALGSLQAASHRNINQRSSRSVVELTEVTKPAAVQSGQTLELSRAVQSCCSQTSLPQR
jgi:hypothetical protein